MADADPRTTTRADKTTFRDAARRRTADPSRYVKRSAHLPHLGEDADHELIDDMELLRDSARKR